MGRVVWRGRQFEAGIRQRVRRNMMQALMELKRWTQLNIDVPTDTHGPSDPGEYPHRVTGDLQRSIFVRGPFDMASTIVGDVGTNLDYGVLHEITDRPFLRRTLHESQAQLGRIILQGGIGGTFMVT